MIQPSHVLALNSGSSSLKFGLYRAELSQAAGPGVVSQVASAWLEQVLSGKAEAIGERGARFSAHDADGKVIVAEAMPIAGTEGAIARIGRLLAEATWPAPGAVGHRIVHGGPHLLQHCQIDETVLRQLRAATAFAPLHIPAALSVIDYALAHFPGVPQVACFDTAFHRDLPPIAKTLPLPRDLLLEGVQRYGFHGLSCESIVHQLGAGMPERVVIAHLGNGASITAVKSGQSIDTSMGLTPTGGVIMSTRSGDLDPGALLYLLRTRGLDAAALEDLVDRESGLLGISGFASDLRQLRAAAPTDQNARLAIAMFCDSIAKQVAGMMVALGGVDLLVFTGGIGENDAQARADICARMAWAGIVIDEAKNQAASGFIHAASSRCAVKALASQEDEQIARHTAAAVLRDLPAQ